MEACVDTLASALAAAQGGADRIELCADLADAGTTPSHGTLALALERLDIPVFPIIRPRGGGFVLDDDDVAVMRADLRHARALGAPGAVIGAVTSSGDVDRSLVALLRDDARDMQLTFHRAFDVCRNADEALEALVSLGVDRVLTSGQQATAWDGRNTIAALVHQAGLRITIMAGGSIDETNAAELVRVTGVGELHVRGTVPRRDAGRDHAIRFRKPLPEDELVRAVTDAERISAILSAARG